MNLETHPKQTKNAIYGQNPYLERIEDSLISSMPDTLSSHLHTLKETSKANQIKQKQSNGKIVFKKVNFCPCLISGPKMTVPTGDLLSSPTTPSSCRDSGAGAGSCLTFYPKNEGFEKSGFSSMSEYLSLDNRSTGDGCARESGNQLELGLLGL